MLKKENAITSMKNIVIEYVQVTNVNRKSVTLEVTGYVNGTREHCNGIFATQKIANKLLRAMQENGTTDKNQFFIVEKAHNGIIYQWLAIPSIFA